MQLLYVRLRLQGAPYKEEKKISKNSQRQKLSTPLPFEFCHGVIIYKDGRRRSLGRARTYYIITQ
jgi:hypothetical protein